MNDLERAIVERLDADGDRAEAPLGLAERIEADVERRRLRHRRVTVVGAAAVTALVIGAAGLIGPTSPNPDPRPADSTRPRPVDSPEPRPSETDAPPPSTPAPPRPGAVALPPDLMDLLDMSTAVSIPRHLPDGGTFDFVRLYADGTVLGKGPASDPDPDRAVGSVWAADPSAPTPSLVRADVYEPSEHDVGPSTEVGLAPKPGEFDYLECRKTTDGRERDPVRYPLFGATLPSYFFDQDVAVWYSGRHHGIDFSVGCEPPRDLGENGIVLAFRYPLVYVWDAEAGMRRVNVETLAVEALPWVPTEMRIGPQFVAVAVNDNTIAWLDDDRLIVADLGTGETLDVLRPTVTPVIGHLVAGDRVITRSTWVDDTRSDEDQDSEDADHNRQVAHLYDPGTGELFTYDGLLYAAGEWLIWTEGLDRYRMAKLR